MLELQWVSLIVDQSLGSNMALEQLALIGDGPHYWDNIKSFKGLWNTVGEQACLKLKGRGAFVFYRHDNREYRSTFE